MTKLLLLMAVALSSALMGCMEVQVPPNPFNLYTITGSVMGAQQQAVLVFKENKAVGDLSVKVNGQTIPEDATGTGYVGALSAPVAVGGPIRLEITTPDGTITAQDVVPEAPVVTAPSGSASVSQPIEVRWTSARNPTRFRVFAATVDGNGLTQGIDLSIGVFVAGTARSITLSAGSLPSGANIAKIRIRVSAFNDGLATFQGPKVNALGSRLAIQNASAPQEIVPSP
jgi:hypothetical protein